MKLDWDRVQFVCKSAPNTIMGEFEIQNCKVKSVVHIGATNKYNQLRCFNILHVDMAIL